MIKWLLNKVWTLALIAMIIFAIFAGYQRMNGVNHPKFFGIGFGIVVSGSMEPNLPEDSFIIIHEKQSYNVGDIITYTNKNGVSVTHRIDDINGEKIIPKGDANSTRDTSIEANQIVGKVVCHFPVLYFIGPIGGLAIFCLAWCIFTKDEE